KVHEVTVQLTRNVIRKVPNQLLVAFVDYHPPVEIERIAVVQFESRVAEFLAQKICQPRIFLQRQQTRAALQNLAGEGAKPRPNFQDKIVPADLGLLDNPARQVLVVQEILSQFFRRSHAGVVERYANL